MAATLDKPRPFVAFDGSVDAASGIVKDVSIIQCGPVLGGGVFADQMTLKQVKKAMPARLKAKTDHWSGVMDTIGYYSRPHIDGDKLKADLHIFESFQFKDQLLEMLSEIPSEFGISIYFAPAAPETDDATGNEMVRVQKIYSADLVDIPAANRDGMFSADAIDNGDDDMPTDKSFDASAAITALETKLGEQVAAFKTEILDAIKALAKPAETPKVETPPAATTAPAFAITPELTKALAAAIAPELLGALSLKANEAKPANATPTAQEPTPAPAPKAYAELKKEFIGDAKGLDRMNRDSKFCRTHGVTEAEYLAKQKTAPAA